MQCDQAVPPSSFGRFSDEPLTPAHIALLARCIMDPNCAENLDLEGNKLVVPDADRRQETLAHLEEADELIGCGTHCKACTVGLQLLLFSLAAGVLKPSCETLISRVLPPSGEPMSRLVKSQSEIA